MDFISFFFLTDNTRFFLLWAIGVKRVLLLHASLLCTEVHVQGAKKAVDASCTCWVIVETKRQLCLHCEVAVSCNGRAGWLC